MREMPDACSANENSVSAPQTSSSFRASRIVTSPRACACSSLSAASPWRGLLLLPVVLLLQPTASSSSSSSSSHSSRSSRQVRMYWSRKDPAQNLANLPTAGRPTDYITGVILCCNDPVIDYATPGRGSPPFSGTNMSALVAQYKAVNLTVHVCVGLKPKTQDATGVAAAMAAIPQLVEWASEQGIDGVVVDYEPSQKPYLAPHAASYAAFLKTLGLLLRLSGMEAGADLASWGILNMYSEYSKADLGFVTTMSTWYQGRNLTQLRANTESLLAGLKGAPPTDAVHLGISNQCKAPDPVTCGWTEASLSAWFGYIDQRGLAGVDIWTPDSPQNTPPWMFAAFKKFLAGGTDHQHPSPLPVLAAATTTLKLDTSVVISTTRDEYVSYNLDSTSNREYFTRNLSNPLLAAFAAPLSPAFMRVGGSGANILYYHFGKDADKMHPAKYVWHWKKWTVSNTSAKYLEPALWRSVCELAAAGKAQLILNANMIQVAEDAGHNLRQLLEWTIANGYKIHHLEPSNELGTPTVAVLQAIHGLLVEIYPDQATRPGIIGSDDGDCPVCAGSMRVQAAAAGVPLFAANYHKYDDCDTVLQPQAVANLSVYVNHATTLICVHPIILRLLPINPLKSCSSSVRQVHKLLRPIICRAPDRGDVDRRSSQLWLWWPPRRQ